MRKREVIAAERREHELGGEEDDERWQRRCWYVLDLASGKPRKAAGAVGKEEESKYLSLPQEEREKTPLFHLNMWDPSPSSQTGNCALVLSQVCATLDGARSLLWGGIPLGGYVI